MQLEAGAVGLCVAKISEAEALAECCDDFFMAYPPADAARAERIAEFAQTHRIGVAVDSSYAINLLDAATQKTQTHVRIMIDCDTGAHRTGIQSSTELIELLDSINTAPYLDADGLMYFAGHLREQQEAMAACDAILEPLIAVLHEYGIEKPCISGGGTPSAYASHHSRHLTEIRPGTMIFNDMNGAHLGLHGVEDCAASVLCTVISDRVAGQCILDAGSKALSSDSCYSAPDSGFGFIREYPEAKIVSLNEEHAYVDISACSKKPRLGEQLRVIPNHICPCVNLYSSAHVQFPDGTWKTTAVTARGALD